MTARHELPRRHALALAAALVPAAARADGWPDRPVRLVVPFAPGGPTDVPARLIADGISAALPHRLVVENRTGAGVVIGTDIVAKGPRDGSLLLYSTVAHAVTRALFPNLPFDPVGDFAPVALVGRVPMLLVVHPALPAADLPGLVALLRAEPGRHAYASPGIGSAVHLATELFLRRAGGLSAIHVPFRAASATVSEVIAGRVPIMFTVGTAALPQVRAGQLRALAIATPQRSPLASEIPTFAEQGLADFEPCTWHMLLARAGTPEAVLRAANAAANAAVAGPAVRERLPSLGIEPVSDSTPETAAAFLRREIALWEEVVRSAGIRVE
jgi:tripartite-type tricarboxylate transporter receptor subunit TctC